MEMFDIGARKKSKREFAEMKVCEVESGNRIFHKS